MLRTLLTAALVTLFALPLTASRPAEAAATCRYVLGFQTLHDLIPQQVGSCLEGEQHATNGDALQRTTGGLLVWRKADNWTAFTDGYRTWVNGPAGLAERLNSQRFAWEANPEHLPLAAGAVTAPAPIPPISVRQPQPYDLVDVPIQVAGVGTGFEGAFAVRVRDGTGAELARRPIHAGGTGILGDFSLAVPLDRPPATPQGSVEVFEPSAKGDGSELNRVVVPVIFGPALLSPYHGFALDTVRPGETPASIAGRWYGDPGLGWRLVEANRGRLADPQHPAPGQVLRIPQ